MTTRTMTDDRAVEQRIRRAEQRKQLQAWQNAERLAFVAALLPTTTKTASRRKDNGSFPKR